MIFYRLKAKDGKTYSNFETLSNFEQFISQNTKGGHYIKSELSEGIVELIATDLDANLFLRNKMSKIVLRAYGKLFKLLKDIESEQSKRYTIFEHNLITTHSRLQDSIGSILPEKQLVRAENYIGQIAVAEKAIQSDTKKIAELMLNIAKRIVDLQAQLEGFKMLSGNAKLDLGQHNIKPLLENIVHPYYEEFDKNWVKIKWYIDDKEAEANPIKTDYKILNVALHHLLNNASKYTKPHSTLEISFDQDKQQIRFKMTSTRIDRDEIERIFEFEYCGRNVPQEMAGDGIGMYMAKVALQLLGGDIFVEPEFNAPIDKVNEIRYTSNVFIIQLPLRKTKKYEP